MLRLNQMTSNPHRLGSNLAARTMSTTPVATIAQRHLRAANTKRAGKDGVCPAAIAICGFWTGLVAVPVITVVGLEVTIGTTRAVADSIKKGYRIGINNT